MKVNVPIVGEVDIPVKFRLAGNFIPDITIDPDMKSPPSPLMEIIQPRLYVLIYNKAYMIDYKGNVKEVDPQIFNQPTALDRLRNMKPEQQFLFLMLSSYITTKVIKALLR